MESRLVLTTYIVVLFMMMGFSTNSSAAPSRMPDTTLWLEVVVNGKPSGKLLPVDYKAGHYWLTAKQLVEVGLSLLNPNTESVVAVDNIKQVQVEYNSALQQLLINLPTSWLPAQHIATNKDKQSVVSQSSNGLLMNYDLYVTSPEDSKASDIISLWSEQRFFSQYGVTSNTGIYKKGLNGETKPPQNNRYMRYDTQWSYNNEQTLTRYAVGDVITDALTWSNAVRLGGFQFARNFSIRPDLVTYPLPKFTGQAAVPSTVDLYINSYKVSSSDLNPGPFTLDTQPYVTGGGNATVVTTDALGRKVSTTVPFYVANTLLAKGLTDYSITGGAIRQKYGEKSFSYSSVAGSGVIRRGVTDWLTLESRADIAANLFSAGVGSGLRVANWGVLNMAFSQSKVNDSAWGNTIRENDYNTYTEQLMTRDLQVSAPNQNQGQQLALGYSYSNTAFSINAQRLIRSEGYADLSTYKSNYRLSRRQDQLTGSLGLDKLGNVGIGYFAIKDATGARTRLVNFSWNIPLWRNSSLYTSINKEIGGKGYSGQLSFSIPLGDWGTAGINSSRDVDNHWVTRTSWSKSAPIEGGLGWNTALTQGGRESDKYRQADLTWRSQYFEARGGMYGRTSNYTRWGELTGSIVAMQGGVYATNMITDAFAIVSTNGFADIPVSYENKYLGDTNQQGYLLVPYVTAWYRSKIAIDPLNLPADVKSPDVEQLVSIRDRSGLVIKFALKNMLAVSFKLVDSEGNVIPRGSVIKVQGGTESWVGWDGQVWLEDLTKTNKISVTRADNNQICHLQLELTKGKGIIYLEQQVCH